MKTDDKSMFTLLYFGALLEIPAPTKEEMGRGYLTALHALEDLVLARYPNLAVPMGDGTIREEAHALLKEMHSPEKTTTLN